MSSYQHFTDAELAQRLQSGDEKAFTEIFNRYWQQMYCHALKVTEDEDAAKDIVQEMFVNIWRKSDRLVVTTNLAGYLYTATRSRVLNYLRTQQHETTFETALTRRLQDSPLSPIDIISARETTAELESGVRALPGKMKEIFELSRKDNLSHKEIATVLDISIHTVKKQINRALKIIRFRLS